MLEGRDHQGSSPPPGSTSRPERPSWAEIDVFQAALYREKLLNARRLNLVRFVAVTGFFALFVVLAGVMRLRSWQGNLTEFCLYWALTAAVYLGARRRDSVALLTTWAIPLVDMPMVFVLQHATFGTATDPKATAGYSIGFFVVLLMLVTFSLERWRIWFAAAMATLCEGGLQAAAGVEVGAVVATAILMAITAVSCSYAGDRLLSLVDRLTKDVQDRKRAEERLVRMERLASIGRLAASIGHDLRNPLSAISTAAYILGEHHRAGAFAEGDGRVLEIITREVHASNQIISKLLDMARDRPIQLAPNALRDLVAEAITVVSRGPSTTLHNDIPQDFPTVHVDRDLFRQILVNLAQNAVEALPEAGGTVHVSSSRQLGEWSLRVQDDGAGMSSTTRAQLFEPLYTTKPKGTGLGLTIVQTMVEKHGGRIEVDSQLGRGTTFTITLPIRETASAVVGALPPRRDAVVIEPAPSSGMQPLKEG